jgi:hypothetical protein
VPANRFAVQLCRSCADDRANRAPLEDVFDVVPTDAATPEDAAAETQARRRVQRAVDAMSRAVDGSLRTYARGV